MEGEKEGREGGREGGMKGKSAGLWWRSGGWGAGRNKGAAESSTTVNEELENPCELWVFIDIEEVRENLYPLLLLGKHRVICSRGPSQGTHFL